MKTTGKDKSTINLCIDIILLLLMMSIAGLGFLMKYVLLSGDQRNLVYGQKVDLSFWGLTRHQWGDIHLILSVIFLLLLLIHIILHWKMIVCVFQRMIPYKSMRIYITVALTSIGLLLFLLPFFIQPDISQRVSVLQNPENRNKQHQNISVNNYPVQGNMTLREAADQYNVPEDFIAKGLNIAASLTNEKIGRLRKQYGFTLEEISKIISEYKAAQ
jgi:hypothetical protein